jgi:hypothetical protein
MKAEEEEEAEAPELTVEEEEEEEEEELMTVKVEGVEAGKFKKEYQRYRLAFFVSFSFIAASPPPPPPSVSCPANNCSSIWDD